MARALLARSDPDAWLASAVRKVADWGLVLDSDQALPSWPSMVVESRIQGSWWAHPDAHLIHSAGSRLTAHPDVLHVVLVSGKQTCIHRRLHAAFLSVALADEDWKIAGLGDAERRLLRRLRSTGRLFADELELLGGDARRNGRAMRELERRLLCAGGNVHTTRGWHSKFVTTWGRWAEERKVPRPKISPASGRRELDECLRRLNREFDAHGTLPWWPARARTP